MRKSKQSPLNGGDSGGYFELWSLLGRVRDAINRCRQISFTRYGISPEQFLILVLIEELKNRATVAEIARRTFRKPSTISLTASRMIESGLIRKTSNPKNKNINILSSTSKGAGLYQRVHEQEIINDIMSSLSDERREQLRSCLSVLLDAAVAKLGDIRHEDYIDRLGILLRQPGAVKGE
jgi:DNA-binding MarR family transcriptional regulator